MGNKYSEQGIQREEEKRGTRSQSIRELKEKKRRGELGVIAARNAKKIYSRGDQEVRAENTKRRRVEGNKKSEQQGVQRSRTVAWNKKSEQQKIQREEE